MSIADLRREYETRGLDIPDLDPDPLVQFDRWIAAAIAADLPEPNAMTLATATPDGARGAHGLAARDRRARLCLLHQHRQP